MIAVADSSVLITLGHLGRPDLLTQHFPGGVLLPPAAWHEVVEQGAGRPGTQEVRTASWLRVEAPSDAYLVAALRADLEDGEAEAIVLALEKQAIVLLDEREARKRALALGLTILGTVGLLIWAKRRSLIDSVQESLDLLRQQSQFRLSAEVYRRALQESGEL